MGAVTSIIITFIGEWDPWVNSWASPELRAELQAHGRSEWLTQMLALDHSLTGATFGPLYPSFSLNWKLLILSRACQRVKFELGTCRRGWRWPGAPAVTDKCGDQAESALWSPHYRGEGESQPRFLGEHWKDHPFQTRVLDYRGAQSFPLMARATTTFSNLVTFSLRNSRG